MFRGGPRAHREIAPVCPRVDLGLSYLAIIQDYFISQGVVGWCIEYILQSRGGAGVLR